MKKDDPRFGGKCSSIPVKKIPTVDGGTETVEEFLARGGRVSRVKPGAALGATLPYYRTPTGDPQVSS